MPETQLAKASVQNLTHLAIRPRSKWVPLDLRELWNYRELLYFLAWRDVKVRYKQTALGVAWAVLQPLLTVGLFGLLFGRLAGIPSDGQPYPIFAYAGVLPWVFFSNALTGTSNSLIGNANLVTKIYFPRILIPASAVIACLVDFAFAFAVYFLFLAAYGIAPSWAVFWVPALALLAATLALGVGLWMAALNVRFRDVRYALPFVIQLWMFASPVIYPSTMVPVGWRLLYFLNPVAGLIEGFRTALLGLPLQRGPLVLSIATSLILLVGGAYYFRRTEARFADVI